MLVQLAGLLASYSGTCPHIEPNHTKALAGSFTAAWQQPCQCLHTWVLALAACWGIQLLLVSFTQLAATMISCLLTNSPSPRQQHSVCWKLACDFKKLSLGVNDELQNTQAILPSSEILSER
jgi:hypothetical protein